MDYKQALLAAGLPVVSAQTNQYGTIDAQFERELTPAEWQTYLAITNPQEARKAQGHIDAANIPNWATWTQAQFAAWCDANLMTDAQIDATTLSAALKANIKANNAFTRNAGKMLIAMRDYTRIIE